MSACKKCCTSCCSLSLPASIVGLVLGLTLAIVAAKYNFHLFGFMVGLLWMILSALVIVYESYTYMAKKKQQTWEEP